LILDEVSRVYETVGVIREGHLLETVAMQDLSERYSEVVCELSGGASVPPTISGFFGWQNRGREWSVAIVFPPFHLLCCPHSPSRRIVTGAFDATKKKP